MIRLLLVCLLASWTARAAVAVPFDPERATPYFTVGPAAEAMRSFRTEDWSAAATRFDAYVKATPQAADRRQARFLAAYARSKSGQFAAAAKQFSALIVDYPLLADHHRLYAARALLATRQPAAALGLVNAIAATSALDGEARLAGADALVAIGRRDDAAAALRGYLASYPNSWREAEARLRLAEASEASDWPAARTAYRAVYIAAPTTGWARRAEGRLQGRDPAALDLSSAERLERGLALFTAMRNEDSEATLRQAMATGDLAPGAACVAAYHLAQSVFKQRNRPRAAALFDDAALRCGKVEPATVEAADLQMKALYQGGRCHAARGDLALAVERFAAAEAAHPTHSYADDARLRLAETYDAIAKKRPPADAGVAATEDPDAARSRALLAELIDKYPGGDLRGEAAFRLFFGALRGGRLDEAKGWLATSQQKIGREEGWWEAGRTLYWLARLAERTGNAAEAQTTYARCAREYPLAYYSLLALHRLQDLDAAAARKLIVDLAGPPAAAAELAWRFAPRPLFGEAGFRRGIELARLGLGGEAKRELSRLGIRAPEKGAKVAAEEEELLWLAAVLYDRAGEYALSHAIPRHTLTAYARRWPQGEDRRRWLLSYPRGYAYLVILNMRHNPQPEALEFAIIREESAFDPLTESFANAVGLTQLTQPPAKRFANGLPFSREALRDPAINVAIGARELGHLWTYYEGNGPLAIASYNAGEGAVNRWLRAAPAGGPLPLDEFVESIPYDETRGYTKRVIASWFAYQWLYGKGDPLPPLRFELPRGRSGR